MHCIFPAVRTAFVFLPVLTSLYGRFKGRAEGGHIFLCGTYLKVDFFSDVFS